MLQAVQPLSFVELAIRPDILADAFWFAIDVGALVGGAVGQDLVARALLVVVFPVAFVETVIIVDHDALAVAFGVDYFSEVDGFFELLELEVVGGFELVEVEDGGAGLVLLELLVEVVEGGVADHGAHVGFGDARLVLLVPHVRDSLVRLFHQLLFTI